MGTLGISKQNFFTYKLHVNSQKRMSAMGNGAHTGEKSLGQDKKGTWDKVQGSSQSRGGWKPASETVLLHCDQSNPRPAVSVFMQPQD
jgi:hypothetical protein